MGAVSRARLPSSAPTERTSGERLARRQELLAQLRGGVEPLSQLVADWPEEWLTAWHERAGIMEFDGGLPGHVAEREAERCVREEHARAARGGAP